MAGNEKYLGKTAPNCLGSHRFTHRGRVASENHQDLAEPAASQGSGGGEQAENPLSLPCNRVGSGLREERKLLFSRPYFRRGRKAFAGPFRRERKVVPP